MCSPKVKNSDYMPAHEGTDHQQTGEVGASPVKASRLQGSGISPCGAGGVGLPLWWTVRVTQPSSENGPSSPNIAPEAESGALFYDRPGVAERYGAHRHGGVSSPNFVMEEPALLAELGDVAGQDVLDLGCGDAALGAMLLQQGCTSYLGIDGSQEMVARAAVTIQDPRGTVALQNMEELSVPAASVDLVVSRLALHYLEDLDAVLRASHAALRPGGRLCFSVLHPVITSSDVQSSRGPRGSWTVDDYFVSGARERLWMGDTVTWFHRTIEQYVGAVNGAGFNLTALRECEPEPDRFGEDEAELTRRRRVPLFLLVSARMT